MTGIIEHMAADIAAIKGMVAALAAQQPTGAAQTVAQPPLQPGANLGAGLLGGAPAAPQATGAPGYPPATQEMIVALVTPLVNDPNTKALLQQEMHAMSISALPEAQPHQYPELYARFQRVQQQVAAQQPPQPAATPASII
jgi:hypothetical protein